MPPQLPDLSDQLAISAKGKDIYEAGAVLVSTRDVQVQARDEGQLRASAPPFSSLLP